jgi:hypothetical protein
MIFYELSEHDQTMIQDYINAYGELVNRDDVAFERRAPLKDILRRWEQEKEVNLYKLFNEQFILRKPIKIQRSRDELIREVSTLRMEADRREETWYRRLLGIPSRYLWIDPETPRSPWAPSISRFLCTLIDCENLTDNKYYGPDFKIYNPDEPNGKVITISNGCKTMKAIAKILNCCYGETFDFDAFRIKHSQILNQKELHGTLCLSIHPMDYITMSDNASGWSSCMGWMPEEGDPDPGCYRRGTVEMMNSKYVVVAYLEGADPLELNDLDHPTTWSNKKWRTLAIVSPDVITTIKSYPYANPELSIAVVEWLRELAQANMGWTYEGDKVVEYNYKTDYRTTNHCFGEEHGNIYFTTKAMYNDFGATLHYGVINPNVDNLELCYSGTATCMLCGNEWACYSGNEMVYCEQCCEVYYCACCENRFSRDELIFFHDEYICDMCYDDETEEDIITGETYWRDEFENLYLMRSVEEAEAFEKHPVSSISPSYYRIRTPLDYSVKTTDWDQYFKSPARAGTNGWQTFYYITVADLTARGLRLFEHNADWGYACDHDIFTHYDIKEEDYAS